MSISNNLKQNLFKRLLMFVQYNNFFFHLYFLFFVSSHLSLSRIAHTIKHMNFCNVSYTIDVCEIRILAYEYNSSGMAMVASLSIFRFICWDWAEKLSWKNMVYCAHIKYTEHL